MQGVGEVAEVDLEVGEAGGGGEGGGGVVVEGEGGGWWGEGHCLLGVVRLWMGGSKVV